MLKRKPIKNKKIKNINIKKFKLLLFKQFFKNNKISTVIQKFKIPDKNGRLKKKQLKNYKYRKKIIHNNSFNKIIIPFFQFLKITFKKHIKHIILKSKKLKYQKKNPSRRMIFFYFDKWLNSLQKSRKLSIKFPIHLKYFFFHISKKLLSKFIPKRLIRYLTNYTNLKKNNQKLAKNLGVKYLLKNDNKLTNRKLAKNLGGKYLLNFLKTKLKKYFSRRSKLKLTSFSSVKRLYLNIQNNVKKRISLYFQTLKQQQRMKKAWIAERARRYRRLKIKFKGKLFAFYTDFLKRNLVKVRKKETEEFQQSLMIKPYYFLLLKLQIARKKLNRLFFRNIKKISFDQSFLSEVYIYVNEVHAPILEPKHSLFFLLSQLKKKKKKKNKNKIKFKLPFYSKLLLRTFLTSFDNLKNIHHQPIDTLEKIQLINHIIFKINLDSKPFFFKKLKQSFLYFKKLNVSTTFQQLTDSFFNLNFLQNKQLAVKSSFTRFMQNNILFPKMNLTNPENLEHLFLNSSDILRAEHFRTFLNKEQDFFVESYKKQDSLKLLTTITGHNIYLTLFFSNPYQLLWKASSGMLGLKHFRRAKKHQITFKDLLTRCQLFMLQNRLQLQGPFQLIIRHLNYQGTRTLLRQFEKKQKPKFTYERIKNNKLFTFFKQSKNLLSNYALKFMSSVWIRFKEKVERVQKKKLFYINKIKQLKRSYLQPIKLSFIGQQSKKLKQELESIRKLQQQHEQENRLKSQKGQSQGRFNQVSRAKFFYQQRQIKKQIKKSLLKNDIKPEPVIK